MARCQTGLASRCLESAQFVGSILSPVRKTAITKIIIKKSQRVHPVRTDRPQS